MGWAKFDDRWATHAKLLEAGLEAAGLDARAICWCAGQETDGFVPDAAVSLLAAGHRNPAKLAGALVRVRRWARNEERKGYDIHDYLDYNPTRESRDAERDRKREAGRAGGLRSRPSRPEADCLPSASAKPKQVPTRTEADSLGTAEPPSRPVPSPSSSSVVSHQVGPPDGADDDDGVRVKTARSVIAERRMAGRSSVDNPARYRSTVLRSVDTELGDEIGKLAGQGLSADEIADALEPIPSPKPAPMGPAYPDAAEHSEPVWDEVVDEHGQLVAVPWSA